MGAVLGFRKVAGSMDPQTMKSEGRLGSLLEWLESLRRTSWLELMERREKLGGRKTRATLEAIKKYV